MKFGRGFKLVAAGLVALLSFGGASTSATAAAAAQAVYSPDVLAVDTTEVQFSVVANAQSLSPNLSIQLATDYSFGTLAANQLVPWGQTLDNQDHEFTLTIGNLNQDTLYFVRAVLATTAGTSYSELAAFRTLPPVGVVINEGQTHTNSASVTLAANAPVGATAVELSNSATFLQVVEAELGDPIDWALTAGASGEAATVYARYILANQTKSAVFTDDIIFDNVTPSLSGLLTERIGSVLLANQLGADADSAVVRLEYGYAGKTVSRPYAEALEFSLALLPEFNSSAATTKLSVRAIDRAGNTSDWYLASVRAYPTPTVEPASFASKRHAVVLGDWGAGASFVYQWMRNGKTIARATAATYTHVDADLGAKLSVRVTVAKRGVVIKAATTASITVVQLPSITKGASVSGKAKVGQTLTIAKPTAVGYPVPKISYRWLRCTKASPKAAVLNLSSYGCKVIAGATKSSYKLTSSDVSKYVVGNTVATGTSSVVTRVYAKSTAKVVR